MRFVSILACLTCPANWVLHAQIATVGPFYVGSGGTVAAVIDVKPSAAPPEGKLLPQDFSLIENGRVTSQSDLVTPFRESGRTLSVVLAVDMSGSVRGRAEANVKTALLTAADDLVSGTELALVSFADDVRVEYPFGHDSAKFCAAVNAMHSRGRRTKLYDGIETAIQLFQSSGENPREFRRVLVISDGKDEGSTNSLARIAKEASRLKVPVDSASVDSSVDRAFEQILAAISQSTSGRFYQKSSAELSAVLKGYFNSLQSMSFVRFTRASVSKDSFTETAGIQFQPLGRPAQRLEIPIAIPASQISVSPQKAETGNSMPLWLLIGLPIILLAAGCILFLVRRKPQTPPAFPLPSPIPQEPDRTQEIRSKAERRNRTRIMDREPAVFAPQPERPKANLLAIEGPVTGLRFPLDKIKIGIGGDRSNELSIEMDREISPRHAFILYENGFFLLYDQDSRNGTFVNGHKVTKEACSLKPGDEIRVGSSLFRFTSGKNDTKSHPAVTMQN